MSKNLVIVESPAKAKTIEGFLGKDFIVKSSFGHIRDLVKKGFGVDIENNFTPTYEVQPDKERIIAELKKLTELYIYLLDKQKSELNPHIKKQLDEDIQILLKYL